MKCLLRLNIIFILINVLSINLLFVYIECTVHSLISGNMWWYIKLNPPFPPNLLVFLDLQKIVEIWKILDFF